MRSAFATFAAAALLVAGTSGAALAAGTSHEFSGNVSHVNATAKTLIVRQTRYPRKEMSFELAPNAKILWGKHAKTLTDLRVGQHVMVSYSDKGRNHEAHRIELRTKTAAAKSYRSAYGKSTTKK